MEFQANSLHIRQNGTKQPPHSLKTPRISFLLALQKATCPLAFTASSAQGAYKKYAFFSQISLTGPLLFVTM